MWRGKPGRTTIPLQSSDRAWISPDGKPSLVSVIVPCYNRAVLVREALDSVLQRTGPEPVRSLLRALQARAAEAGHEAATRRAHDRWLSTVGAVALDRAGNLAAATSTGGMTNKRWGRVGDSPIIGAGTYADNRSCAVSATGHGEYFIRATVARDICARVQFNGAALERAADEVINGQLRRMGGDGGIIAIDRNGEIALTFNTPGMYRARIAVDGELFVEIYHEED